LVERLCDAEQEVRRLQREGRRVPGKDLRETLAELRAAKDAEEVYEILGFDLEPGFWWGRR
jgi:hypothetical protein